MALTASIVEQLAEWYGRSEALADTRVRARSDFFGYDEPGTVKYMPGAEDVNGREMRFLGWFGFSFRLPDGQHPAELAATAILAGSQRTAALRSIQGARYVMGVVTTVGGGRSIFLKLQSEEFEVESRVMPRFLQTGDTLCVHVLPIGRNRWLPALGWVVWPVRFGFLHQEGLWPSDPLNGVGTSG